MSAPRRLAVAVLVLAALALADAPAAAHKLRLFAFAETGTIRGSVYFGGSVAARGVSVVAYGPDGRILARTVSAEDGGFVFDVGERVDHRIVADTGDGHHAEVVIAADRLAPVAGTAPVGTSPAAQSAAAATSGPAAAPKTDLVALVDAAVARHVGALQAQLALQQERTSLRDVLGGLGYILGLAGLAAFMLGRRRPPR